MIARALRTMTSNPAPAVKRPIDLLRGWPSQSLLPTAALAAAASTALSNPRVAIPALLYGPDEGYAPLRTEISRWLASFYGGAEDPGRICITGGASQNLACVLQVFTDPGVTRLVWMAAPCYFLACRIFEDAGFGGRLRAVPEDAEGLDAEHLEKEIRKLGERVGREKIVLKPDRPWSKTYDHIIYTVPDFSNPSGKTMSLRRREQLVSLARNHNALIITDDVYDRLQWPTSTSSTTVSASSNPFEKALLPRLTDIDRRLPPHPSDPRHFGHTLSNSSFSKILGPGVRTGWAEAHPVLAYGLSQCGSSRSGGCPSNLVATIIAQLLRSGSLQAHIHTVLIPAYARRWASMMAAIERCLVPLGIAVSRVSLPGREIFGGYFIWIELPKGVSAERVSGEAKKRENLTVAQGSLFEVYGDEEAVRFRRWIRVCFSWEDEDKLVEGIERLGTVVRDVLCDVPDVENATQDSKVPPGEF